MQVDSLTDTALLLNPCCLAASFSCWLQEHPCTQQQYRIQYVLLQGQR